MVRVINVSLYEASGFFSKPVQKRQNTKNPPRGLAEVDTKNPPEYIYVALSLRINYFIWPWHMKVVFILSLRTGRSYVWDICRTQSRTYVKHMTGIVGNV